LPDNTQVRRFTGCIATGKVSAGGGAKLNFDFSGDLKQLRNQARRFMTERCPPAVARRSLDGEETLAADLCRRIAATVQSALLSSPNSRIAGGSDESLRNIIAERVLGMPPDIRVDKGNPFNQVPAGRR
jgi:hypothetical protein